MSFDKRNLEELVVMDIKTAIKNIFNITGVKIEYDNRMGYVRGGFQSDVKLTFDHKSYVVTFSNELIKAKYPFHLDYRTFYLDIYVLMAFLLQRYNNDGSIIR